MNFGEIQSIRTESQNPGSNDLHYAEPISRRSATFAAGGYTWSIQYYHYSAYATGSVDLCLQLETRGVAAVTASISFSLLDPTAAMPPWKLIKQATPVEFSSTRSEDYTKMTQWVPKSKLNAPPGTGYLRAPDRFQLVSEPGLTSLTKKANSIGKFVFTGSLDR